MPRAQRSDARLNETRLREAAVRLFAAEGSGVPLDRIAAAAGVSIGTLYNHFPRREDILAAVLPEQARAQLARIRSSVATAQTGVEALRAYVDAVIDIQETDRLLGEMLARPEAISDETGHICAQVMDLGRELVSRARRQQSDLLLNEESLVALILANGVVQRSESPSGWKKLMRATVLARVAPTAGADGARAGKWSAATQS